jgi:glycyl-tRNA synthetase
LNELKNCLKSENKAFEFHQVEAPLLTPRELINPNYTDGDIFVQNPSAEGERIVVLRPETTMGSYAYAQFLLNPHRVPKNFPPMVVWQHGKSFRREQDQPTKFMRLKEFHQLEFQIIFSETTANDYSIPLMKTVFEMIQKMIGPCKTEDSDRLPSYAEWTKDIVHLKDERFENDMEVCSVSLRKDFPELNYGGKIQKNKVLEVAIGTDRCVHRFYGEKTQS